MRVLICSGGGAGVFAYAGADDAMRGAGWHPDVVAGASAGALAGALIAAGRGHRLGHYARTLTGAELWASSWVPGWDHARAAWRAWRGGGLLDPARLHAIVDHELRDAVVRKIPRRSFEAHAVDLRAGRLVTAVAGEDPRTVREVVKGSAALPVLLPPLAYRHPQLGDVHLVDGGVMHNHPTQAALAAWRRREAGEPWDCVVLSAMDGFSRGPLSPGLSGLFQSIDRVVSVILHDQARRAREVLERHGVPFRWVDMPTDIDLVDFTTEDAMRVRDQAREVVGRELA